MGIYADNWSQILIAVIAGGIGIFCLVILSWLIVYSFANLASSNTVNDLPFDWLGSKKERLTVPEIFAVFGLTIVFAIGSLLLIPAVHTFNNIRS